MALNRKFLEVGLCAYALGASAFAWEIPAQQRDVIEQITKLQSPCDRSLQPISQGPAFVNGTSAL